MPECRDASWRSQLCYTIRDYVTPGKIGDVYYGRMTTSFRVRPGVEMMLDSLLFIDSVKAGSGVL